jgi:hypothetical protein
MRIFFNFFSDHFPRLCGRWLSEGPYLSGVVAATLSHTATLAGLPLTPAPELPEPSILGTSCCQLSTLAALECTNLRPSSCVLVNRLLIDCRSSHRTKTSGLNVSLGSLVLRIHTTDVLKHNNTISYMYVYMQCLELVKYNYYRG